ncbi:MAG TPA: sigma-70 family RNA polymerase sigma factor [Pyrinomonadaceae bacterium]|nr:sigma-70 family RNA polymerase sigma factor [Pyrinomonadaceae bacterium]
MAGSEPAQKSRLVKADETDERRLVEAAQQDRACFGAVYEKYFGLVYGFIARRVRERTLAEDLTSEVFRKALANLPRFKWTGAPFGAWLLKIAANMIADRAKRDARLSQSRAEDSLAGARSSEDSQASLEHAERRAQLFRLVDELPNDQKRVVVLRFAEEKSIKEIALELGRSEGAVKQLQFRALESMRARLAITNG